MKLIFCYLNSVLLFFVMGSLKGVCSPTFEQFYQACNTIPPYTQLVKKSSSEAYKITNLLSGISGLHFKNMLDTYLTTFQQPFTKENKRNWATANFFKMRTCKADFAPFVVGFKVAAGTKMHLLGDRHGDVRSTVTLINHLKSLGVTDENNGFIIKPGNLIICLGDYTDRGFGGAETLYFLLRLKAENPDKFFLVRGNHEDLSINERYGFYEELRTKFNYSPDDFEKIKAVYNTLPVAIFVGSGNQSQTTYIAGCHGFIDSRYNPKDLLKVIRKPHVF